LLRVAVLDDYQAAAHDMADWGALPPDVEVEMFHDHLAEENTLVERLERFDVVIGMRERTPFPRSLLERLPALKMLITTGMGNAAFDFDACTELGIVASGTSSGGGPGTMELTWGLILALARHVSSEDRATRAGQWQTSVGDGLADKTLGVIGLGNIGSRMAAVGNAFQMPVIAWSQNLTAEKAAECAATLVTKDELLARADFVTIHLRLSDRTRGLIGRRELEMMKPTAYLVNTSRGPIVDEAALVDALEHKAIAGAGLDVFDQEPLPPDHPLRRLENTVITPHLGYVTLEGYQGMYGHAVENIQSYLEGQPARVINPDVLGRPNLRQPS